MARETEFSGGAFPNGSLGTRAKRCLIVIFQIISIGMITKLSRLVRTTFIGFSMVFVLIRVWDNRVLGNDLATDTLEKMKLLDKVYYANCTFQVQEKCAVIFPDLNPGPTIMTWNFTMQDSKKALIQQALEVRLANPAIVKAPGNPSGFIEVGNPNSASLDQDGNRCIGLESRIITFFDTTKSAQMRTQTMFSITKNNEVNRNGFSHLLYLCKPDSTQLSLPIKKMLWMAGRGFANQIIADEIVETSKGENKLGNIISLKAKGLQGSANPGVWNLKIDPKATYLVREATFTQVNQTKPTFTIVTSGMRTEGSCVFPETALWKEWRGTREVISYFNFNSCRFEFDQAIFEKAVQTAQTEPPYNPYTFVMDFRTNPPSPSQTDATGHPRVKKKVAEDDITETSGVPSNRWLYLFILLFCFFVLILMYIRFRRSKRP